MRVEIVTECEHGKSDPHRWDPSTTISDEGWCPGGSRRVLEPGEYVLVEKVNGEWPWRVRDGFADVATRSNWHQEAWDNESLQFAIVRTLDRLATTQALMAADALAEGEQ